MIYYGTNIQSSTETLKPVEVSQIHRSLIYPKPEIAAKIRQLKIIHQVDPKQYARAKKTLPYFVCGNFNPPYRKTENFAYIEHFVIDIDDISENNLDLLSLRNELKADPRTELLFASPSHNGLKVMFRMKERCYDYGLFSTFYKDFARRLGAQYHIEAAIDTRTSDVCRACFISSDSEAYYNANAEPVNLVEYLSLNDPTQMFDLKHELDEFEKEQETSEKEEVVKAEADPSDLAMNRIKEILAKRRENRQKQGPDVYVPEELEELIGGLKAFIEDNGVEVYEIVNIQYGKKIKCKLGTKLAEINLFYGKRGYRVVTSPKSGVSAELNSVLAELIQGFIDDNS